MKILWPEDLPVSCNELERMIIEKNVQLSRLNQDFNANREEVLKAYGELDRILFMYYKVLGSKSDLSTLKKINR